MRACVRALKACLEEVERASVTVDPNPLATSTKSLSSSFNKPDKQDGRHLLPKYRRAHNRPTASNPYATPRP